MSPPGGRDTDRDWETLGREQPYWGVFTDPAYAGRTELGGEAQERFFGSGEAFVARLRERLETSLGAPATIRGALDFGCGVGRLLIPMRARAQWAAGVDVAASMRAACRRHLDEAGFADTPVTGAIAEAVAAAPGPIDWINSFIVLQHIPPARGLALIEALAGALAPGGALSLHVTAYSDPGLKGPSPRRAPLKAAVFALQRRLLPVGTMMVYDYDLSRVLEILTGAGLGPFVLEHEDHGGHHGFIIYARKAA